MTRFTFDVVGMSSANCERILVDRLISLAGVDAVNADHEAGELVVVARDTDREELEQTVAGVGYTVTE